MADAQLSKDLSVPDWNVSRTRYFLKSFNQRTRTEYTVFWIHIRYLTLLNFIQVSIREDIKVWNTKRCDCVGKDVTFSFKIVYFIYSIMNPKLDTISV